MKTYPIRWMAWLPLLFCIIVWVVFFASESLYYTITREDHVIEWLTFAFSFAAFLIAGRLSWLVYQNCNNQSQVVMLLLYAIASLFFAGEEISWGQRIIGFEVGEVSETIAEVNKANEFNLHNIEAFDRARNIADLFCIVWGVLVPLFCLYTPFPVRSLRVLVSPLWLLPAHFTMFAVTFFKKILKTAYPKEEWVEHVRVGELKETVFAIIIFVFILHIWHEYKNGGFLNTEEV